MIQFLIALLISAPAFGAGKKNEFTAKTTVFNNKLTLIQFTSNQGNVNAYLIPFTGITFMASVISQASGKIQSEINESNKLLSGLMIEFEAGKVKKIISVDDKLFSLSIPVGVNDISIILKNKNGKELASSSVLLLERPAVKAVRLGVIIPPLLEAGTPELFQGMFNSDFGDTKIEIGETETKLLAEYQHGVYTEVPNKQLGKKTVKINEAETEIQGESSVCQISVSADKYQLRKGEQANIQYKLSGLPNDLPSDASVEVTNLSENAINLSGGNNQTIQVQQKDITSEGEFSTSFQVTAIQSGNFSVSFDLIKPQLITEPGSLQDSIWSNIDLLKK